MAERARRSQRKSPTTGGRRPRHVPARPSTRPPRVNHRPSPHLPIPATSLIGRDEEAAAATSLLRSADVRPLTLIGPPGVGKTRLALRVATDLTTAFPDGIWFVDLTPLHDPALVLPTLARTLGLGDAAATPLLDRLTRALADRHLLVLLDNVEHVLDAAEQVAEVLQACPSLKILATSREPLHLSGEHTYPVPPLALPDLTRLPAISRLAEYPAIALFVARARAARPNFTLTSDNARAVAEICARLDGLPLAIELAAARIAGLPPQALLDRLSHRLDLLAGGPRDAAARHRTLRAAIEWSHELLSEPERTTLRRLVVFAGGFTLEAAEAVVPSRPGDLDMLDLLPRLVDRSLVVGEPDGSDARYRLLETIRTYARERLIDAGEEPDLCRRHRDWVLQLVETAEPGMKGKEQPRWYARIDREAGNIRAALEWSATDDAAPDAGLRIAWSLWRYWEARGSFSEPRAWLDALLAASAGAPPVARGRALRVAGLLAYRQGDYARTSALGEEVRAIAERHGDRPLLAIGLHLLGYVAVEQGDFDRAETLLQRSIALHRELGGTWYLALSTHDLGWAAKRRGQYDRAASIFETSLALFRQLGDPRCIALVLYQLASVACCLGTMPLAVARFRKSLAICREHSFPRTAALCLIGLAAASAAGAPAEQTARWLGSADAALAATGARPGPFIWADFERAVALVRARLGEAAFAAAWAEGRRMRLEDAVDDALAAPVTPHDRHSGPLTGREHEIASLVAQGYTNRRIAKTLFITEGTAANHIQHILNKLGMTSRTQIAAWAVEQGLKKSGKP